MNPSIEELQELIDNYSWALQHPVLFPVGSKQIQQAQNIAALARAELQRRESSAPGELVEQSEMKGHAEAVLTIEEGFSELLKSLGLPPDEGDGMDSAPAWIISQVLKQIAAGLKPLQITRDDEDGEYKAAAWARGQSQWVPVSEEVPDGQWVIVWVTEGKTVWEDTYCADRWNVLGATHWMTRHTPEPPTC